MIETLGFVAVSALFVLSWAISNAKGDEDAWIHLRRLVVFCKLFLPAITRSLFQALSWYVSERNSWVTDAAFASHCMGVPLL